MVPPAVLVLAERGQFAQAWQSVRLRFGSIAPAAPARPGGVSESPPKPPPEPDDRATGVPGLGNRLDPRAWPLR